MNDASSAGKRLVMRVVLLQAGCAVLVAGLFGMLEGVAAAQAAFAGGLIVAIGSALFGWRMFLPGIAPARALSRALYAAESLKWLWILVALWAALAKLRLPALPLMTGLIFGQFGYWVGLIRLQRG